MRAIPLCALMQRMSTGKGLAIYGLMGNLRMHVAQQNAKDIVKQRLAGWCQQMAGLAKSPHDAVTRFILMSSVRDRKKERYRDRESKREDELISARVFDI